MGAARVVADAIAERGAITFDRFVEIALYDEPHGFYQAGGRAGGRHGDFITSAEVGPLFAAVIADYLDRRWHELGAPAVFRVAECGAGVGTLFRGVLHASPDCLSALEYTLIESSPFMRAQHRDLPGGCSTSAVALGGHDQHVILANELLDNMAFGIAENTRQGWAPVHVTGAVGPGFALAAGPSDPGLAQLDELAPDAPIGSRVPLAAGAAEWIERAIVTAEHVIIFDYGASTAELAARGQQAWLRTYHGHERGSDPFDQVGYRDITHDVPFDQLRQPTRHTSQAEWLVANGITERVAAARATWHERAPIGDLLAVAARSAIGEAAALTDLDGLGDFHVLEWQVPTS